MLKIKPDDEVVFTKFDNGTIGGEIELLNNLLIPIAFKIKTTSPDKFRVRPSTGVVVPGANKFINVVLQSEQQANASLIKDKFLIMSMDLRLDQAEATEAELAELWKKIPSNSTAIKSHRLMCSFNPSGSVNNVRQRIKRDNYALNGSCTEHDLSSISSDSYVFAQLLDRTHRLEKQIKLNRGLQLANLFVVLLLLVGILYIINILLYNNSSDYCIKR